MPAHPGWLTAAAAAVLLGAAAAATALPAAVTANGSLHGDVATIDPGLGARWGAPGVAGVRREAVRPVAPAEAFPIDGPHDLGRSLANRFGGGRGHEGQDLFADCGTPLVAAHDATVARVEYHGAAGNYVVLQERSGEALAYMHLRDEASVSVGEHVSAGEPVGLVGATGRADGCHLHLERWTAPGYYTGGHPVDPLPWLRRLEARTAGAVR
ncbi:MAG TPA: M23 family metallopeptidase [Capillimicrobium sp.]|nr:M23 family metallopeptidase [Capillimicrobium sp.]